MTRFRGLIVLLVLVLAAPALLAGGDEEKSKAYVDFSGFWALNAYTQNGFFLGRTEDAASIGGVSDEDEYAFQIFRLMTRFGYGKNISAVMRADFAQSIWGIDNQRFEGGAPGFSSLFDTKDTGFTVHVDWAYLDATHPGWNTNFKVGRMKYALGNLLVLDQNNDGIQVTKSYEGGKSWTFGWSKVSEGADSLSDLEAVGPGGISTEDADLFMLTYKHKAGNWLFNPFVAYYKDDSHTAGNTYIPDRLQYNRPRFTPQLTKAQVLGLAFNYKNDNGLAIKGEADWLSGDDEIDNATAGAGQRLDINDGDLDGYNLYVDVKQKLGPGKIGGVFGMGSGDDDPFSGDGNINKIRTHGFFYVTEVWEDSIMPDEEGITPQGLGSPASRGYREFENTTLVQINYAWNLNDKWNLFLSGNWIKATEEIPAWADIVDTNDNGEIDPGDDFSGVDMDDDLGTEFDFRLTFKPVKGLAVIFRGGAFSPGDAAGYLINGTDVYDDTAWEGRVTVKYTFGHRVGG